MLTQIGKERNKEEYRSIDHLIRKEIKRKIALRFQVCRDTNYRVKLGLNVITKVKLLIIINLFSIMRKFLMRLYNNLEIKKTQQIRNKFFASIP